MKTLLTKKMEDIQEKTKDLWNWIASNMIDPRDIRSLRMTQKFSTDFRVEMQKVLEDFYLEIIESVEREVEGMKRKVPQQQGKWMPMDDKNEGFNDALSTLQTRLSAYKKVVNPKEGK